MADELKPQAGLGLDPAVLDIVPAALCVIDAQGRIVTMNQAWQQFARENAITLPRAADQAPADADALSEPARHVWEGVRAVLSGRKAEYSVEYACRRSGRLCWSLLKVSPYAEGRGGVVVAHVDITERRLAEEELHAERNFVSAVFQIMPALLVVADLDGRIVRYNKACERVTGYTCEQMYGESILEALVPQEEWELVLPVMERLRAGQYPIDLESHWRCADGSLRLIAWNTTVLLDNAGKVQYLIGTGVDITEQRQAEVQARRRLEELAHANRLQTAGELATMMAHELNQPLGAISSHSVAALHLLRQEPPDKARLQYNLEQIEAQALRAGRSIKQLREFVSRGRIDPLPCDLNQIVRNVRDLMMPRVRASHVAITLDLASDLAPVLAVDVQIEQVLINLIRNSTDAIRDAGMVAGSIVIQTGKHQGQALVSVLDSGPGLKPEQLGRLFDPFNTSKSYGLGVGLRISRSLVEAHHGRLWAEPEGPGGRFHFTLPFAS